MQAFLEEKVAEYNQPHFILHDPVSIPHQFNTLQDIEIAGLWTAILSWGQRPVILNKAKELMTLLGPSPYQYIVEHTEEQRQQFCNFKHRTFTYDDSLSMLHVLQRYYRQHNSLEEIFAGGIEQGLIKLNKLFAEDPTLPRRSQKHFSTPARQAACKRLNMFLRWMVRKDDNGVDFGLWQEINPAELLIPLDLHVGRIARKLNILTRPKDDWKAVLELTNASKKFDPIDPVKYDFALFSLGINKEQLEIINPF